MNTPSKEGRESGECTPSPSSSASPPIILNIVGNQKIIELDKSLSDDIITLSDSPDVSEIQLDTDDNADSSSVQLIDECDESGQEMPDADDSLFTVDTNGSKEEIITVESASRDRDSSTHSRIRDHRSNTHINSNFDFSKVLTPASSTSTSSSPEKKSTPSRFPRSSCFNCNGEHTLDKCDIPHNAKRIARNRAEFFNLKRSMSERYLDTSGTANIKPGHLSDELRKALSLGANDIPEWIYRMRRLGFIDGYPPAYLKQAIDSNENTLLEFYLDDEEEASALFGNDNSKPIQKEKGDPKPPKINADKMIYYFGFNFNSRRLRDRESNFRVPEFKDFVEYHQLVLNDRFRNEQRLKKNDDQSKSSPRKRHHEKKNSNNNHRSKKQHVDDDIEVIDIDVEACANDSNADKGENSNGSENKNNTNNNNNDDNAAKMESSPSKRRRPIKKLSPDVEPGSSTGKVCGTAIGIVSEQKDKPSLDKFSAGVVPFSHEPEDNSHRGFFTSLMKKLRRQLTV